MAFLSLSSLRSSTLALGNDKGYDSQEFTEAPWQPEYFSSLLDRCVIDPDTSAARRIQERFGQ